MRRTPSRVLRLRARRRARTNRLPQPTIVERARGTRAAHRAMPPEPETHTGRYRDATATRLRLQRLRHQPRQSAIPPAASAPGVARATAAANARFVLRGSWPRTGLAQRAAAQ